MVGECPGPGIAPEKARPLFPLPESSSGGRLLRVIGWSMKDYLMRFDRVNLFPTHRTKWDDSEARERADALTHSVLEEERLTDFVVFGVRVTKAFRRDLFPILQSLGFWGGTLTSVPHPSGLNPWYNDLTNRASVRRLFSGFRLTCVGTPIGEDTPEFIREGTNKERS